MREDPRTPLVAMSAVFRGGLLAETKETKGITRLYSRTILKGTKTRTAEQLADVIEGVGGSIGSDSGNNSFTVSVDVMRPDLKLGVIVSERTSNQKTKTRERSRPKINFRRAESRVVT